MWTENKIFLEDLQSALKSDFIDWGRFSGKTFFITGATGLVGYTLASLLSFCSVAADADLKIIALVRNIDSAEKQFKGQLDDGVDIRFVRGSVESFDFSSVVQKIDFVVHGACPTASKFFTERPVETIRTIVDGTDNILKFSVEKKVEQAVFLSSMEVYGEISSREKLDEKRLGLIELENPRSSYPEAKRMAENLCACYASEYGLDVKSIRLAQTFGPGVKYEDERVFAYMMRCALEDKNIELKTSGKKENPYLYTMDAATAILAVLTNGRKGKSYNAANEETYCSVKQMAETVLRTFGKEKLKVETNVGNDNGVYPPPAHLRLSVAELRKTGWKARTALPLMYERMRCALSTAQTDS